MGAANHRLHPFQSRIARRADLALGKRGLGQRSIRVSPLMQLQLAFHMPGTHDLTFKLNIHIKI